MPVFAALIPIITQILAKVIPDPQAQADAEYKLKELMQKGEFNSLDREVQIALAQLEVNKAEASTDMFRGGWRPFAGWVCGMGLAYSFLLRPLLPWFTTVVLGHDVPVMPEIDSGTLLTLLFGMLGLGGLRTFERVKGKA